MGMKRFKVEQIIHKLREAEVIMAKGRLVPEACKQFGVTEQTFYRWRKDYGGLELVPSLAMIAPSKLDVIAGSRAGWLNSISVRSGYGVS